MTNLSISIELTPVKEIFYQLEDVKIKILFPKSIENSNLSANFGDFEFDAKENIGIWRLPKVERNNNSNLVTLKGNLINKDVLKEDIKTVLNMSCKIDKFSLTGGSVTKVNIVSDNQNINKKGKNYTLIKSLEIVF